MTSTAGSCGKASGAGKHFADTAHDPRARIEADRHIGAGRARRRVEVRIVARQAVRLGDEPQRRRRVGRTAAQPGRDRQSLVETKGAEDDRRATLGKRARRLEHEIVVALTCLRRARPVHRQPELAAARKAQSVAEVGERHQAFDLVIAVVAAAQHPQRQIDLGRRVFDQRNGQGQHP